MADKIRTSILFGNAVTKGIGWKYKYPMAVYLDLQAALVSDPGS